MTYQNLIKLITGSLIIISSLCWTFKPLNNYKKKYIATYYSDKFNGRKTTLGQKFSNNNLTVATTEKKLLGKYLILIYKNTSKKIKVYCNDLMNSKLKNKIHFDLTTRLMKYFTNKQINYPGKIELEIIEVL